MSKDGAHSSALTCGCDVSEGWMCDRHRKEKDAYFAAQKQATEPVASAARKQYPVASGVLSYFPLALLAVAHVSYIGNEQHHPGQPLHWDRSKSSDEADALMRHFLQRGTLDTDGMRHSAKVAWRALALLQKELEAERG